MYSLARNYTFKTLAIFKDTHLEQSRYGFTCQLCLYIYIGAIDDNSQDASKVTNTYLTNAIDNLVAGRVPDPATTKAIGCSIKDKQVKQ